MLGKEIQSKALLFHYGRQSGAVDLTVHDVIELPHRGSGDATERFTLGAGRVLGFEEKAQIVTILNNEQRHSLTLSNENLLATTPYAVAWWIPSAERELVFSLKDGLAYVRVMMPSIVAIYCRGDLHFAAVKGHKRQRPTNNTPLYAVPLPNLYSNGKFCTGNAVIAQGAKESNIPAWESFLFDTVNTHLGSQLPLKKLSRSGQDGKSALFEVFKCYEGTGKFPTSQLIALNATLGEWMTAIDKGAR